MDFDQRTAIEKNEEYLYKILYKNDDREGKKSRDCWPEDGNNIKYTALNRERKKS